jgi:hypothetical protein
MPARTSHSLVLVGSLLAAALTCTPLYGQHVSEGPSAIQTSATIERVRPGIVRGTTTDALGGVLPGVTVTVTSADGRLLASTTTDTRGEFVVQGLTSGRVTLSFQLDGFAPATTPVVVGAPEAASLAVTQQLELVTLAERVTVRADPLPPPPPPRPVLEPLPEHDQASVCGPARADGPVPTFGTVRSRHDDETKVLFAAGDTLLIEGGRQTGLEVGQNFVARRRFPTSLRYGRNRSQVVMGEHSAGLLQIVAAEDTVATAVVVYVCDEITRGDYLATFVPEPVRAPEPPGAPVYDNAARLLFADAGQPLGVTGRMLILDRGARGDVRTGQRLTLFRRSRFGDGRPLVLGEGVVVAVRDDSATIRVEHATDAIFLGENGDWAAPQRPPARVSR